MSSSKNAKVSTRVSVLQEEFLQVYFRNKEPRFSIIFFCKFSAINCTFPIPHSLPVFVYIKPPDESTLAELLPDDHVWTEGIGGKKNLYMAGCVKLKKATDALYVLQKHLVELLLINDDDEKKATPSSFRLFVHRMRRFVLENCLEHRVSIK